MSELENILKFEYILSFATLIVPGFITMRIIKLKIPNKDFLLKDVLFEAISYSLLNIVIFGWLPYLFFKNDCVILGIIFTVLIITITPSLLAYAYIKFMGSKWFSKHFDIQIPTAWDWYFMQKLTCLVLVRMKDGSQVIGYFGEKSYATSFPNDGAIYLEKVYYKDLSNKKIELKEVPGSNGILIGKEQYFSIEFYNTAI